MTPSPPPGQGPIDPRDALSPPPPPGGGASLPPAMPMMPSMSPPPYRPAPPWPTPPPAARSGMWFARLIFGTLAVIIFLGSLLLNFGLLATLGVKDGHLDTQTVLVKGNDNEKVAVVPIVNSMILEAQANQLQHTFDEIDKDADVKALVLQIDTPGGSVTAADEMYHCIEQYKAKHAGVPVVVTMGGMATSGGYYAACAGDYLFAQPTTLTGNIGVLLPSYNISELAHKYGVQDATLHSTGADYKEAGSWMKPVDPRDTAYLTDLIDSAFARFKTVVSTGRTGKLHGTIDEIANGKAYTADEAKKLGLVDQIGYPADAYAYAGVAAKLTKMHVVRYDQPSTLVEMLTGSSLINPPKAASTFPVEVSGVDLNTLAGAGIPRLMYWGR